MNTNHDLFELFRFIADFAAIPLCAILWDVQKRLSTIEGTLKYHLKPEE